MTKQNIRDKLQEIVDKVQKESFRRPHSAEEDKFLANEATDQILQAVLRAAPEKKMSCVCRRLTPTRLDYQRKDGTCSNCFTKIDVNNSEFNQAINQFKENLGVK